MKKIVLLAVCMLLVAGAAFGCSPGEKTAIKDANTERMLKVAENAQYLPSEEKLVSSRRMSGKTVSVRSEASFSLNAQDDYMPDLMDGGLSSDAYNALIEELGAIDSPFDREFTVMDIKGEATKILNAGVVFDEWFMYDYEDYPDLTGTGSYFVSYDAALEKTTIIRASSFQPWVYDAEKNSFLSNKDFSFDKPNYPIREDVYYKIQYYHEGEDEVVECEIVTFLIYYEDCIPAQYQYVKNVRDKSFTKYNIEAVQGIHEPEGGNWGYDVDSDCPQGVFREFIQMNYSDAENIRIFTAVQTKPNAYDLGSTSILRYGEYLPGGSFYYSLDGEHSADGDRKPIRGTQPSEEYRSVDASKLNGYSGDFRIKLPGGDYDSLGFGQCVVDGGAYQSESFLNEQDKIEMNERFLHVVGAIDKLADCVKVPDRVTLSEPVDLLDKETFDCHRKLCNGLDAISAGIVESSPLKAQFNGNLVYDSGKSPITLKKA